MRTVLVRRPGGVDALEIAELATPRPGPGDVLIRTQAMGVSRPDVLIRKGVYSWMPPLPASPGNELTGTIEEVGGAVEELRPGQNVLLSARDLPTRGGCYTEFIAVPATAAYSLPDEMDLEQAVVLPTYLVAYAMLHDMGLRETARAIYVTGAAGGVGGALVELAKEKGMEVIGSAGSPERAAYARSLGADHVVNYRTDPLVERVRELTGGRGVDVVFDHIIGQGFTDLLHLLGDFGALVFYNIHAPVPERDVFAELRALSPRSLSLHHFNMHTYDRHPQRRRTLMNRLIDLLAAGRIKPRIGARFSLNEAAQAHRMLEGGAVSGKIILVP
jgi:NADPH2:quinone reductase